MILKKIEQYILPGADKFTWLAAGTNTGIRGSTLQLKTGYSYLLIGGHSGVDPCPRVEQLKTAIKYHQVHYYIMVKETLGEKSKDSLKYKSIIPDKYLQPKNYAFISQNFPYTAICKQNPINRTIITEVIYDLTKFRNNKTIRRDI